MKVKLAQSTKVCDQDGKPITADKDGCIDVDEALGKALIAGGSGEAVAIRPSPGDRSKK